MHVKGKTAQWSSRQQIKKHIYIQTGLRCYWFHTRACVKGLVESACHTARKITARALMVVVAHRKLAAGHRMFPVPNKNVYFLNLNTTTGAKRDTTRRRRGKNTHTSSQRISQSQCNASHTVAAVTHTLTHTHTHTHTHSHTP